MENRWYCRLFRVIAVCIGPVADPIRKTKQWKSTAVSRPFRSRLTRCKRFSNRKTEGRFLVLKLLGGCFILQVMFQPKNRPCKVSLAASSYNANVFGIYKYFRIYWTLFYGHVLTSCKYVSNGNFLYLGQFRSKLQFACMHWNLWSIKNYLNFIYHVPCHSRHLVFEHQTRQDLRTLHENLRVSRGSNGLIVMV
jgi:hypothetical protein